MYVPSKYVARVELWVTLCTPNTKSENWTDDSDICVNFGLNLLHAHSIYYVRGYMLHQLSRTSLRMELNGVEIQVQYLFLL